MNDKYLKNIFAFPGVGVKFSGKEKEFFLKNEEFFLPFMEKASNVSGIDVQNVLNRDEYGFLSSEEERFFTAAFSCGVSSFFKSCGIEPDAAACYSFGVYPALFSAGALTFDTMLKVLTVAEEQMEKTISCLDKQCGMAVVVGLIKEDAEELIRRVNRSSLLKVNENNDTCIIVAGYKEDLELYTKTALEEDAISAEILDVKIPYHHSNLLKSVKKILFEKLVKLDWNDASYPLISSIDRSLISNKSDLVNFVVCNTCTPISWYHTIEKTVKCGAERIFECGHGISLTQNGRFNSFDIQYVNIKNYKRKLNV